MPRPGGKDQIMHAQLKVGDSMLELADASAEFPPRTSVNLFYVDDVDATYARAIKAGATSMLAPSDKPWGDRDAVVKDPGGTVWCISSRGPGEHITPDTPSIVPMFTVRGADKYVDFMKQAFGAQEVAIHRRPDGEIAHARLRIGTLRSSQAVKRTARTSRLLTCYTCTFLTPTRLTTARSAPEPPRFVRWKMRRTGDRTATVEDPAGNLWSIATQIKEMKF